MSEVEDLKKELSEIKAQREEARKKHEREVKVMGFVNLCTSAFFYAVALYFLWMTSQSGILSTLAVSDDPATIFGFIGVLVTTAWLAVFGIMYFTREFNDLIGEDVARGAHFILRLIGEKIHNYYNKEEESSGSTGTDTDNKGP